MKAETEPSASSVALETLHNPDVRVVTLDEPISRGEAPRIETLTLRKPDAGSLRGVSLMALVQIDVQALSTVLPRICEPILTRAEIARLDPADLMAIGSTVASFFLSRADRTALGLATE